MPKLEDFRMKEIMDYYIDLLIDNEYAATKTEARKLFLNALCYNVVSEAVVEQIIYLKEHPD